MPEMNYKIEVTVVCQRCGECLDEDMQIDDHGAITVLRVMPCKKCLDISHAEGFRDHALMEVKNE